MATRENIYGDLLFFIKEDLKTNITEVSNRIYTSYPHSEVIYPMITIKIVNYVADRAGMQTDRLDINLSVEVRVWTKSQTLRDKITQKILNRLANIQFSTSGSIDNDFHDFGILNAIDVDEPEIKVFSKVLNVQYRFFNA